MSKIRSASSPTNAITECGDHTVERAEEVVLNATYHELARGVGLPIKTRESKQSTSDRPSRESLSWASRRSTIDIRNVFTVSCQRTDRRLILNPEAVWRKGGAVLVLHAVGPEHSHLSTQKVISKYGRGLDQGHLDVQEVHPEW